VAEDRDPTGVRVITSDRALIDKVTSAGAGVVSASDFRDELDR
jgi:predicted RNA-binding protein with PIN domain